MHTILGLQPGADIRVTRINITSLTVQADTRATTYTEDRLIINRHAIVLPCTRSLDLCPLSSSDKPRKATATRYEQKQRQRRPSDTMSTHIPIDIITDTPDGIHLII